MESKTRNMPGAPVDWDAATITRDGVTVRCDRRVVGVPQAGAWAPTSATVLTRDGYRDAIPGLGPLIDMHHTMLLEDDRHGVISAIVFADDKREAALARLIADELTYRTADAARQAAADAAREAVTGRIERLLAGADGLEPGTERADLWGQVQRAWEGGVTQGVLTEEEAEAYRARLLDTWRKR